MNRIKHFMILALALTLSLGAWAQTHQRYTGPVAFDDLQVGDTLAPGFELTGISQYDNIQFDGGRYALNGTPQADPVGAPIGQANSLSYTDGNIILTYGETTFTMAPMVDMTTAGNAWVVTYASPDPAGSEIHLSGITLDGAPDPTVPALDETTGHWNFLMPGSNKVVKAVLYDSIVLGPHVELYDAEPAFAAGDIFTRGDSTIYYYDTNNHHSFYLRADEQAGGKYFGFWSDLDPTDYYYTDRTYRRVSTGSFTCGQRFTAAYADNYTLTLVTPQGGGTLSLDGETYDTVYTITFYHMGSSGYSRSFTVSSLPYDTTFNYGLADIMSADVDAPSGKLSISNQDYHAVSVRISGAFEGLGTYYCMFMEGDPDHWNISCSAIPVPNTPHGISANNDGTYSVMEGLTVNVTATPDPAHYLSAIDGHDTVGNYATGYSFVMPSNDKALQADFNAKPTLTLTQTEGGTLEAIIPEPAPASVTVQFEANGNTVTREVTLPHTFWCYNDAENGELDTIIRQLYGLTGGYCSTPGGTPTASGNANVTAGYDDFNGYNNHIITISAPFNGTATVEGDYYSNGYFTYSLTISTTTTRPNVIASSTPNTYIIDYGTPVTVVATPDAQHYLVRFSDDDPATERNRNIAVEKTYDSVIAPIPLTANFQAKPTLTLTANDGGTVTLDGMVEPTPATATIEFTGNNNTVTVSNVTLPHTFSCSYATENGELDQIIKSLYEISSGYNQPAQSPTASGNDNVTAGRSGNNHFITISAPFDGTATVTGGGYWKTSGEETEFEYNLTITILSSTPGTPGLPAGVVSANATLDTFVVDYGTDVTVVATPDATHYLATLGGVTMGSNTAKDTTFTVTATTNLAANFAAKPTLTLAHNDGGEMEIPIGLVATDPTPAPTPTAVANPVITGVLMPDGSMQVTMSCTTPDADIYYTTDNVTSPTCDCPAAPEYTHPITFTEPVTIKAAAYTGNDWSAVVTKTITLGLPAGVIASSTPNTYYIDYNTSVTVKATPSDTAYLVRFDQDADTNSNTAVEKTYGPLTAALTTAEATFNAKPVLTLAQNESWGSVTVEGAGSAGGAGGDVTIGDSTPTTTNSNIPGNSLYEYAYSQQIYTADEIGLSGDITSLTMWLKNNSSYARNLEVYMKEVEESTFADNNSWVSLSEGDLVATGTMNNAFNAPVNYTFNLTTPFHYSGTGNLLLCIRDVTGSWSSGLGGVDMDATGNQAIYAYRDGTPYDISNPGVMGTLLQKKNVVKFHIDAGSGAAAGITQLTDSTYRVDYGTTLTLKATATDLHHVANWVNEDSVAYPADSITYSGYFITEPEPLFPAHSTLRLTVTADATAKAVFGINSYDVAVTIAETEDLRGTVTISYTDINDVAHTVYAPDTVTVRGDTVATLVATAEYGYHFVRWTDTTGIVLGTLDTLRVTEAAAVVAYFDTNAYEVRTLLTDASDGRESTFSGPDTVKHFTSGTVTAHAAYGYHLVNWTNAADSVLGTDTNLVVTPISDTTLYATFTKNVYYISVMVDTAQSYSRTTHTALYLENVSLPVIPKYGYHFVMWSDSVTANPRSITVTGNAVYHGLLAPNKYTVSATADSNRGTFAGTGSVDYLYNDTLRAIGNHGYRFDHWNDGSTENPRIVTVTKDTAFTAYFVIDQFTVTVKSADTTMGTVSGTATVDYGTEVTISATAKEHYHFVKWNDGNTNATRTVTANDDVTYTATFAPDSYTVTGLADQGQGSVTGSGSYAYLATATLTAVPACGYLFDHWSNQSTASTLTFQVTGPTTLTAYFRPAVIDTVTIHDTTVVEIHDTTVVAVDTMYIPVPDTTLVPVTVYDTTVVPVTEYDTTLVPVVINDTTIVPVVIIDSTLVPVIVPDTTLVPVTVYDTTTVPVVINDTTIVPVVIIDSTLVPVIVPDTTLVPVTVYDTTTVPVTWYDTTTVPVTWYDTTIVPVTWYDTTHVPVTWYDTTHVDVTVVDSTLVPIHDTVIEYIEVHDTIWLTEYIYDTVYIHDTIIITGVDDVDVLDAKIYADHGEVVVEGANYERVMLFDAVGRLVAVKQDEGQIVRFGSLASGAYLVKIGNHPARRVVVIR